MRKMKRTLLTICTILFAIALGLFAISCADEDTSGGFSLDRKKVTVRVGEEPQVVRVLKDGEEYQGAVAWATLDKQFLSVSQGHITGVSKGEGEVTATVYVGSKTYTLYCDVTIDAEMYVLAEDIFAVAGTGDIEVTVSQGSISPETTLDKISVKRSMDGEDVQGLLNVQEGGNRTRYFLKNSAATPLDAGIYYICYEYSMEDVTRQSFRKITVRGVDRYQDLFLLSALDGTEYITGRAANSTYTEVVEEKENPGEFFVYADGVSVEKGMNETKEEFLKSLADSGYKGLLDETVLGHDTVYRMYSKKGNAGDPPYPYYYVNLFDSANPVYNNLDQLPASATIDVWARLWHKELGSDEYTPISGGSMAIYRNMNAGATRIKGVSGAFNEKGGWTKYSMPVSSVQKELAGAKNIAIKIDRGGVGLIGTFYLEIYSVELSIGDNLTAPFGEADLTLVGGYTGLLDNYSWTIKKGETVVKSSSDEGQSGMFVTGIPAGEYTVSYTFAGKDWVYEKGLLAGVLNGFSSAADLGAGGWHGDSSPVLVDLAERGIPTPQSVGYDGPLTKTTALEITSATDNLGQSSPYIPLHGLFEKIDDYGENAHVELWVYFDAQTPFTMTNMSMYASEGSNFMTDNNVDVGVGVATFVSSIKSNKWERVRIFLSDIKQSMEEGETYNGLAFYFRPGEHGYGRGQNIYFYTAEMKERITPSGSTIFEDLTMVKNTAWGTTSVLSLVSTPSTIGVPSGKTDVGKMVSYTSDHANQTMFELLSSWYRVEDLLALNDNDVVGLWVYVDGNVSMTAHTLWIGIERDWNRRSATITPQSQVVAKQWCRWDFKVSEIRQGYEDLMQKAQTNNWSVSRATMMLKLAATGNYTLYLHSVDIVKAK